MTAKICHKRKFVAQIPTMEVIWSVLTMVLASAKNFETLVAVRFFVGALAVTASTVREYESLL